MIEVAWIEEGEGMFEFRPGHDDVESVEFDGDGVRVVRRDGSWLWYPSNRVVKIIGGSGP